MKNKWQSLIIILLAICLISITIFAINNQKEKLVNQEPEKIYVGKDTEEILDNFSREDAVNTLNELLVNIGIDDKDRDVQERLAEIEKDDVGIEDVLSDKVIDKLYLEEEFGQNDFNLKFTASALLVYNQVITDAVNVKDFKPIITEYDEIIYLDTKLLNAHIPLDIFIGSGTGIAFEMQYIDGEWKLNPYTSIMSLNLMSILNEGR